MFDIKEIWKWFSNIFTIRKLIYKVKQTSIDFYRGVKEYRNLPSELKEACYRIQEYYYTVKDIPKSERDDLDQAILDSYEEVILKWAGEKLRPVYLLCKLCYYLLCVYLILF